MAVKKNNVEKIRVLKTEGHDLIDLIIRTGVTKTWVYKHLAERLGSVAGSEHFYNMFTERDVRKAIAALEHMYEGRLALQVERERRKRMLKEYEQIKKKEAHKNTLPLAEQKRLLANKPPPPKKPFIYQILKTLWKNLRGTPKRGK